MKTQTPRWLHSAIFYEVYPQSFYDSNGDGIGDLPGLIEKLDYIVSLGCDAIWLNPCFVSPFQDAGYDVSDFYRVAPRYGTNGDLKRLFREAHRKGLRVVLDLVAGHTSMEHPWFRQSASATPNPYTNWYIWTDSVWANPGAPFEAVKMSHPRDGAFLPNFFSFQPALNYGFAHPDPAKPWQLPVDHPDVRAVRAEMMKIMRYWLDLGADGFRVDMASSLVKGDIDFRETSAFWREVRAVYDRDYPEAVLIAEWSSPRQAIAAGFHIDFLIHFNSPAYTTLFRHEAVRDVFHSAGPHGNSFFDAAGKGDIMDFLPIYQDHYARTKEAGFISIPSGNHDLGRLATGRTPEELKVAFVFLMTMPGIPYLYMGDEIGMRQVEGLPSKEGGYGRTGARTPMQWEPGRKAGFSTALPGKFYLPLDPDPQRPNVAAQDRDPGSLLNHIRLLARLRKSIPALQGNGRFDVVHARKGKYPFIYSRRLGKETVLVALNPGERAVEISLDLPAGKVELLAGEGCRLSEGKKRRLRMKGISYGIYRLTGGTR